MRVGLKPNERQAISHPHATLPHARPSGIRSRRLMTNSDRTTSSRAADGKSPVGWVVLHAKEIAEGIPAAFSVLRLNSDQETASVLGIWLMPFGPPSRVRCEQQDTDIRRSRASQSPDSRPRRRSTTGKPSRERRRRDRQSASGRQVRNPNRNSG